MALPLVKALVTLQIAAAAGGRDGRVLGKFFARPNGFRLPFERFHSLLPVACHRREFMLPGQRKSHSSHDFLLRYRRREQGKRQGSTPPTSGCLNGSFSIEYKPYRSN